MIHVDYPPEGQALWDAVEEEYRSRKKNSSGNPEAK